MVRFTLIVLVVLMVCGSAMAAPDSTRVQMRSAAMEFCGLDTTGTSLVTTAFLHRRINLRCVDVAKDFPAVSAQDTIVTDTSTRFYDLESDLLQPKWCRKFYVDQMADPPDTGDVSLVYVQDESTFQLLGGLLGTKRDPTDASKPRYWSAFNNQLSFYPFAGTVDTFVVAYYANANALTTDATVTTIDPEYRQYVILLVAHDICVRMGDYERAGYFGNMYERARLAHEANRQEQKQDKYLMEQSK